MPAAKKPKGVNKREIEAVELVPDAWPKFEKLVKSVVRKPKAAPKAPR